MTSWSGFHRAVLSVLILLAWTPTLLLAQNRPSLQAYAVETSVSVDGRLDEPAWQQAQPVSDFIQFEPVEGAPATQRTEVRVLYGPGSLYVGAVLYDDDPAEIEQALGRRDAFNRADWFLVAIDSYFDRKTAYAFAVNAAGVQFDALQSGGNGGAPGVPLGADPSWDAIWYSDVRATPEGWVAEMQIPYSMLRFPDRESQTWGLYFMRRIPRLGEQSEWPHIPRVERENLVARFGLLTGITGIDPRRNLQIRPYTMTRLRSEESLEEPGEPARDGAIDLGGDVKIGLGPNVTLDATVNPDFGQVESDPAVLNLTAFETVFDERRPFFVEGTQIYEFSAGPGQLLYTRRIGAQAPIIGAAKLTGRTAAGLSFGLLGASTGHQAKPERHYGVARMSRQIGDYSSAGGILTLFDGPSLGTNGRQRSVVGGADWDLRLLDNRYGLEGFASMTHRHRSDGDGSAETGFAGKIWTRKRHGAWTGFIGFDVFNDRFNPNDLGRLNENNFIAVLASVDHEIKGGQPFGPFLRASADAFSIQRFSYRDGLNLGQSLRIGSRWMLRGFQQIELGASVEDLFGGYDLYETRGLGPWRQPFSIEFSGEFETDERRNWQIEPEVQLDLDGEGGRGYGLGLRAEWNAGSRVSLSSNLEGEWEADRVAWSSNETFLRTANGWMIGKEATSPDGLSSEDYVAFEDQGLLDTILAAAEPYDAERHYVPVFGARDTRSLDLTLRSTITFTKNLSLQLFSQLFLAQGRYDRFQILQHRDRLVPFEPFPKRNDFALSSLQSNMVLRWEYRPGSTLYIVWTHSRRADEQLNPLAPWGPSPFGRPIDDQVSEMFDIFPSNVFLIKLNYAFLY